QVLDVWPVLHAHRRKASLLVVAAARVDENVAAIDPQHEAVHADAHLRLTRLIRQIAVPIPALEPRQILRGDARQGHRERNDRIVFVHAGNTESAKRQVFHVPSPYFSARATKDFGTRVRGTSPSNQSRTS